ncbi:MAG: tetratricopeptide repeat protein [Acidobacteria bacterium]|nr:tetratricopeptide repeat protein [Acidobacteriota bacterium]
MGAAAVFAYNPRFLTREQAIAQFVVRQPLLDRMLADLRDPGRKHRLLIGSRGMGKTTMLRRLRFAIEDDAELSQRYIPLSFPEEQWNVNQLWQFWRNCLESLQNWLTQKGVGEEAEVIERVIEGSRDGYYAALRASAQRHGKRLVLLVDNAQSVIDSVAERGENPWTFRETLLHDETLVFIGASPVTPVSTYDYDKPFYEFFVTEDLDRLSNEESETLIAHLAARDSAFGPKILEWIAEDRSRLPVLNAYAGGNPRAHVILYSVLQTFRSDDLVQLIERVLDNYTPLYKARMEEQPDKAREVLAAVAEHWDPITAAEVARRTGEDVNAVSTHLMRLAKEGVVEKVVLARAKRTGFQVAERLFNIWYLMRTSERRRDDIRWLGAMLRLLFKKPEISDLAEEALRAESADRGRVAQFKLALASTIDDSVKRRALEISALTDYCVFRGESEFSGGVSGYSISRDAKSVGANKRQLRTVERLLRETGESARGWDWHEVWLLLGGAPDRTISDKVRIAKRLVGISPKERSALIDQLRSDLATERARMWSPRLADQLREAIRSGEMVRMGDWEGALLWAEAHNAPELKAHALIELRRFEEAERALDAVSGEYRRIAVARIFLQQGEYSKAESELQSAKAVLPEHAAVCGNYSWLLLDQGRSRECEPLLRRAIELCPGFAEYWTRLADLLLREKRIPEASEAIQRAVELNPLDAVTWSNIAMVHNLLGHYARGEEACRKALKLDNHCAPAHINLGVAIANRGKLNEAERAFRRAVDMGQNHVEGRLNLAAFLIQRGDREQALEHLKEIAVGKPAKPSALSGLAGLFLQIGDVGECVRWAGEAIQRGLMDGEPHFLIGMALARDGRLSEAAFGFELALRLNPNRIEAMLALGETLLRQREFGRAVHIFRRAHELQPNHEFATMRFAESLQATGDFAAAKNIYRDLLRADGNRTEAARQLAGLMLREDEVVEAESLIRQALRVKPTDAKLRTLLGQVLLKAERTAEAIQEAEAASKLAPSEVDVWSNLGVALAVAKRFDDAEKAFEMAVSLDPGSLYAVRNLISCYNAAKRDRRFAEFMDELKIEIAALARLPDVGSAFAASIRAMNDLTAKNWSAAAQEIEYLFTWKNFEALPLGAEIVELCRRVLAAGYVKEFLAIFDSQPLIRRRWRPLVEALKAVEFGSEEYLRNVSPEVRNPAAQFYKLLTTLEPARQTSPGATSQSADYPPARCPRK